MYWCGRWIGLRSICRPGSRGTAASGSIRIASSHICPQRARADMGHPGSGYFEFLGIIVRRSLSCGVDFREQVGHLGVDRRTGNLKFFGLNPISIGAVPANAPYRVDDPNMRYRKPAVVLDPLLHLRLPVLRRQDFYRDQLRSGKDRLGWHGSRPNAHIGNADISQGNRVFCSWMDRICHSFS